MREDDVGFRDSLARRLQGSEIDSCIPIPSQTTKLKGRTTPSARMTTRAALVMRTPVVSFPMRS